ncbi:MAG: response regulator [Chloroflexi bacterium]|nr:response regulator [Chloroflexota bacterium]
MPINVLAIDDDPAMTELLNLLLISRGFDVKTANAGNEGVKLLREFVPDVIILDLMMPGMNGWQVCGEVRQFSNVPILILSALDNPGNVASALDAGADDYLVKPVPSGVLVAHINNLARRTSMNNHNRALSQPATASI